MHGALIGDLYQRLAQRGIDITIDDYHALEPIYFSDASLHRLTAIAAVLNRQFAMRDAHGQPT